MNWNLIESINYKVWGILLMLFSVFNLKILLGYQFNLYWLEFLKLNYEIFQIKSVEGYEYILTIFYIITAAFGFLIFLEKIKINNEKIMYVYMIVLTLLLMTWKGTECIGITSPPNCDTVTPILSLSFTFMLVSFLIIATFCKKNKAT